MILLSVLLGVSVIYLSVTNRIEAYIKILSLQGFILFCLTLFDAESISFNIVLLIAETLFFRAILVPYIIRNIAKNNDMFRESKFLIPSFYSLIITSLILGFGFFMSSISGKLVAQENALYFGLSISIMITAMFFIINHNRLITHVIGYMIFENGIFLLSMAVSKEMPIIVNLGALLDIFLGLFLLGLFATRISNSSHDDVDDLNQLKD